MTSQLCFPKMPFLPSLQIVARALRRESGATSNAVISSIVGDSVTFFLHVYHRIEIGMNNITVLCFKVGLQQSCLLGVVHTLRVTLLFLGTVEFSLMKTRNASDFDPHVQF